VVTSSCGTHIALTYAENSIVVNFVIRKSCLLLFLLLAVRSIVAQQPTSSAEESFNRGLAHYHHGRFEEALADLNTAIQLNASLSNAYY
jgi:hypothetical protein